MELTIAGIELDRRRLIGIGVVALACIAIALFYRQVDVEAVHARAEQINGALVFALIVVLPLAGFPVSVTHAIAGMRFGLGLGLALVACSILLQHLASYALVRSAPGLFEQRLRRVRERLPQGAHGPVTLFAVLVPGIPYFMKNYVLPLIGVPLRTALLWSASVHIVRSVVGVGFGHLSDDLTPLRITAFAIYFLLITAGCTWAFRRVQAKVKDQRSVAGGPTLPG